MCVCSFVHIYSCIHVHCSFSLLFGHMLRMLQGMSQTLLDNDRATTLLQSCFISSLPLSLFLSLSLSLSLSLFFFLGSFPQAASCRGPVAKSGTGKGSFSFYPVISTATRPEVCYGQPWPPSMATAAKLHPSGGSAA